MQTTPGQTIRNRTPETHAARLWAGGRMATFAGGRARCKSRGINTCDPTATDGSR
jgi:hypothetical protein